MDAIQRCSAYHGRKIVELNTNPDVEFEERYSNLTLRQILKIGESLPDKLLDMKYSDFIEIQLKSKEEAETLMEELFDDMTVKQEKALYMLLETFFGD